MNIIYFWNIKVTFFTYKTYTFIANHILRETTSTELSDFGCERKIYNEIS